MSLELCPRCNTEQPSESFIKDFDERSMYCALCREDWIRIENERRAGLGQERLYQCFHCKRRFMSSAFRNKHGKYFDRCRTCRAISSGASITRLPLPLDGS